MTAITDKKLRDKLMKEKTLEMMKTIEMIKQNTYEKKNKKNTIPEALITTKEKQIIKEEQIQRMENFGTRPITRITGNRPCRFCNAPNWSPIHKCPAQDSNCNNCGKKGHNARVSKQRRKINRTVRKLTKEEETERNETMSDTDESIYHIEGMKNIVEQQKHYTAKIKKRNAKNFYYRHRISSNNNATRRTNNEDDRNPENNKPIPRRKQNEVKFWGKVPVDMKHEKNKQKMEILITERTDIKPLLGMDWTKKFKLTIGRIQLTETNQLEKEKVIIKFPDLFENNRTIKNTEIKIQLKPGHFPVKQKARLIPLHLQEDVARELENLIKAGHLDKVNNVGEDSFVSPVVITVKKDKSGKIALDSRKLNDNCIKRRPHMLNMEELLSQSSVEITRDRTLQLFISKIDLDYTYGQTKHSEETSEQCVFAVTGAKFSGYYRYKKWFYGLADIPTIFQEKFGRTLEYSTPAWLDDIIVVTRGNKQEHEKKLFDVLSKLEKTGYRASKRKSEIFLKRTKWRGHEIDENGNKTK